MNTGFVGYPYITKYGGEFMQIMWSIVLTSHNNFVTKALLFDDAGKMIVGVLSSYNSDLQQIILTVDALTGFTLH